MDFLQGRSRGKVRETYMKKDPTLLKEKYINAMSNVLINHTSSVVNQQLREFEKNEEKINKLFDLISVIDIKSEELDI